METQETRRVLTAVTIENLQDLWDAGRGLIQPDQVRRVTIRDALADTGATTLGLPARFIKQLGLTKSYEKNATSSGGTIQVSVYQAVRLTIELRDLETAKLDRIIDDIRARAKAIASATATEIAISELSRNPPALASPDMQRTIERASAGLGLRTARLPSGAGHDAQMMAQLGPMGMIFVPSVAGISHSPKELTRWEDCANGANVLLASVVAIDSV